MLKNFIQRKQYVPGFFMINYNKTYAKSFGTSSSPSQQTQVHRTHLLPRRHLLLGLPPGLRWAEETPERELL